MAEHATVWDGSLADAPEGNREEAAQNAVSSSFVPGAEQSLSPDEAGEEPAVPAATRTLTLSRQDAPLLPAEGDLAALRKLLFQREIDLLNRMQERLDNCLSNAHDVSEVIAEALVLRAGKDEKLARALEPVVEKLYTTALRKKPREFTNVLFPLMGPAIRRSIAETFRSMLQSFNKSVEMAFSWKGLRWRFEALRTGKPFSEVVLLHTLLYRVEQLFLIHSETGLVLTHISGEGVDTQDADMVSAMLTAIQDFVRDCFASGQEENLESMQFGEFTVMIEKSAQAYLACVVRGTPPADFRERLRIALELVSVECAEALASFNGDTAPFAAAAHRYLEDCLISRFMDEDKPLPFWVKCFPVLLLLGLAGGYGYWKYTAYQESLHAAAERARVENAIAHLRKEPGLMVVSAVPQEDGRWRIQCLRDEKARSPLAVLVEGKGEPDQFVLDSKPYVSYESAIVTKRIADRIAPPPGVDMYLDNEDTLHLAGTAPMDWILQAREDAMRLPGVKNVDLSAVTDPRMQELTDLIQSVEAISVEFPTGKDLPVEQDMPKLTNAVETLVDIEKLSRKMGLAASLTIYGHADAVGMDKRNYEISQARARTLASMLYARGSSMPLTLYGMGAEYAGDVKVPDQSRRRIELRVHLARAGDAVPEVLKK